MKKAVVTGGAGFIGSHLVDALVQDGVEVLVIDDFSSGREENLREARAVPGSNVTVVKSDISDEAAARAVEKFKPDSVFHLAAQMNVRKSVEAPGFDAAVNVVGIVTILEAARVAGAKSFVFSSTGGAIYGEQDYFPADEQHPNRPKCPYGVSKRAGELYLEYYAREYGMKTVSLRFANVYGPRQNSKGEAGVVAIFTDRLIAGQALRVNGDGQQTRDFVYVGDVVDACVRAVRAAGDGYQVYNVGTGSETSVNGIVRALEEICSSDDFAHRLRGALKIEHGPSLPGEQQRSVIDAGRLGKDLGWKAQMPLKEGLLRTLESFLPASS